MLNKFFLMTLGCGIAVLTLSSNLQATSVEAYKHKPFRRHSCTCAEQEVPYEQISDADKILNPIKSPPVWTYCPHGATTEDGSPPRKRGNCVVLGQDIKDDKEYIRECLSGVAPTKVYLSQEQIEVYPEKILIELDEDVLETDALYVDQGGVYAYDTSFRCPHCHKNEKIPLSMHHICGKDDVPLDIRHIK